MMDCIKKELGMVCDMSLISYVSENIKREDIKNVFKSYLVDENIDDLCKDNNIYDTYNESYNDTLSRCGQVKDKDKDKVKEKVKEKDKVKDINKEIDLKSFNLCEYVNLYEQNIGTLNGVAYEWIKTISEEIDINLFKKAILIATDKGKCNKGYIGGIIKKWINNNIKTYDDLKEYELNKGGIGNDTKSKYATEYEREDDTYYQKPTKEQLRKVR